MITKWRLMINRKRIIILKTFYEYSYDKRIDNERVHMSPHKMRSPHWAWGAALAVVFILRHRYCSSQSRQSVRLSLQSSELAPPVVLLPSRWFKRGGEEGGWGEEGDRQSGTLGVVYSLYAAAAGGHSLPTLSDHFHKLQYYSAGSVFSCLFIESSKHI